MAVRKRTGYWYEKEDQAVVDFVKSESLEEKDRIYREVLEPALIKLVSSIIRRYKLFIPDEEYEETFYDALSFLVTKLDYYNPERGYKAYSYCGTICKNYLLFRRTQYSKNLDKLQPFESQAEKLTNSFELSESVEDTEVNNVATDLSKSISEEIKKMIQQREKYELSDNEVKVGQAMCQLFDNWEEIIARDGSNKLNKSIVLYFLREETMMSTKEIRDNMKKYKEAYKLIRKSILT